MTPFSQKIVVLIAMKVPAYQAESTCQALGLPVRIGVVRAESDEPLGRKGVVVEQGTKVFNLFNMFGRSG